MELIKYFLPKFQIKSQALLWNSSVMSFSVNVIDSYINVNKNINNFADDGFKP